MHISKIIQLLIIYAIKDAQGKNVLPFLDISEVEVEHPADLDHGDYSTNICMKISKLANKKPKEVGESLIEYLKQAKDFSDFKMKYNPFKKFELVCPGFLNIYLSDDFFQDEIKKIKKLKENYGDLSVGEGKKIVVEHTAVNPNKAMHVGHLRNSILGDSLARIFKKSGYNVQIENYIDDTGVQVADIVTALETADTKYDETIHGKFDYYCWDLYSEIQKKYEEDPALKEKKTEIQLQMEEGKREYYDKSVDVVKKVLKDQLATLAEFNIFYDFLFSESIVLQSSLWEDTLKMLKNKNQLVLETEGPNKDCQVIKDLDLPNKENMLNPDKVLITSKGNVTYTAKDLAHHFWKFGFVSNIPFVKFGEQTDEKKTDLWFSKKGGKEKQEFYKFEEAYAVVDARQAYNFDVIKAVFKKFGYDKEVKNLHHVAYGLVSLSRQTVKELGFEVSDDKKEYEMSGRKGLGVKVDDLLEKMTEKVKDKQDSVEKESVSGDNMITPKEIAVAGIKAYMLKFSLNHNIIFDIEDALKLTGDSGPYLQYTHARIKGILRKAEIKNDVTLSSACGELVEPSKHNIKKPLREPQGDSSSFYGNFDLSLLTQKEEIILFKKLYRFEEIVFAGAKNVTPGIIYNYLIELCQDFNSFYNQCPILSEEDSLKNSRLVLIESVAQVVSNGLGLLGISAPERM